MTRPALPIRCTCSETQLHHVGCDCEASREFIVSVWPNGYADRDGPKSFRILGRMNPKAEAARRYGALVNVYSVQKVLERWEQPAPATDAQARAYTRHDNT